MLEDPKPWISVRVMKENQAAFWVTFLSILSLVSDILFLSKSKIPLLQQNRIKGTYVNPQ